MSSSQAPASAVPELIKMDEPQEQVNTRPAPKLPAYSLTTSLDIQKQLNRAEINKAVDIRPASIALLSVNSADRYGSLSLVSRYNTPGNSANPYTLTSPADFTINIPQNLMNGYFTRVAVSQFQLVWSWPNVCPATNGFYINYQPGGTGTVTPYLIQFPANAQGTYGSNNQATLAPLLQALIRTAVGSATFTVAFNTTFAGIMYYSSGNTDKFYFSRWPSPTGPNAWTLFEFFGFSAQQILATTQQGTATTNTQRTPYLDIVCEQITANQSLRDASTTYGGGRTLLQRIYLQPENTSVLNTGASIATNIYEKTFPVLKWISWPANQPIGGALRFQLLDAQGYVLTCGAPYNDTGGNLGAWNDVNMGDWNMVLQFSEN